MAEGDIECINTYFRAVNYLTVAQLYLLDNPLLERPLEMHHVKPLILGHWGTCPGINFIYAHLNYLITKHKLEMLLVVGPGHAAAAVLANLYLEGTLGDFYPEFCHGREGMVNLVRNFAAPNGFPTELGPHIPGSIYQGGELGYSLATAFGAVQDNPNLVVACIVGDGEAETGPLATAWHGVKFLNPERSGTVLPILHLNGYKIDSPTIYATMSDEEIYFLFRGYGYLPRIVSASHHNMMESLEWALRLIKRARLKFITAGLKPRWPILILRTLKGWTGIKCIGEQQIEGTANAHKVPIREFSRSSESLRLLYDWLLSYKPDQLFDLDGKPVCEILSILPSGARAMGRNPHAYAGRMRQDLSVPLGKDHAIEVPHPGVVKCPNVTAVNTYLPEVIRRNSEARNFRIFSPDELVSNGLSDVFKATKRCFIWPIKEHDTHLAVDGRVMEILSEHTCEAWLEGYLRSGRHGIFVSFEAFMPIIQSMTSQYIKWLKKSEDLPWRRGISSLNYLISSLGWRNSYSHQNPEFLNSLLTKHVPCIRVYLPPDANSLLACIVLCLQTTDRVNAIVIGKTSLPQWLSYSAARQQITNDVLTWDWVGGNGSEHPDIIFAASGDYPTLETIVAIKELRTMVPALNLRFVCVSELTAIGSKDIFAHALDDQQFRQIFVPGIPLIYNFHGYPSVIKALLFDRRVLPNVFVHGYQDEGHNTTALDMQIRNHTSRYHLILRAIEVLSQCNSDLDIDVPRIEAEILARIEDHWSYVIKNRVDPPEIREWQ